MQQPETPSVVPMIQTPSAALSHRTPPFRLKVALIAAVLTLCVASTAAAQQKPKDKKLYCWDEGGRRVCSDALPASAVGRQRTEFDQNTGTAVNRVARALTQEERTQVAIEEEANKIQAQRDLREMAMVSSYETEQSLERAFHERLELIEESLKGSALALTNLHNSLISLLRQANDLELQSKPVGNQLRKKIIDQHAELLALRALEQRQLTERETLDGEFQQALSRYRELKAEQERDSAARSAQ